MLAVGRRKGLGMSRKFQVGSQKHEVARINLTTDFADNADAEEGVKKLQVLPVGSIKSKGA